MRTVLSCALSTRHLEDINFSDFLLGHFLSKLDTIKSVSVVLQKIMSNMVLVIVDVEAIMDDIVLVIE